MINYLDTLNSFAMIRYGREIDSLTTYFNSAYVTYMTTALFFGLMMIILIIIYCRLWVYDRNQRRRNIITYLVRIIHKMNVITTTKK